MNASRFAIVDWLRKQSPVVIFTLGLLYELALEAVDVTTPATMNFALFYLLGIAFVGWGAGARAATLLSIVAVGLIQIHDFLSPLATPEPGWSLLWNTSTRVLVLAGTGWLSAEVTRLARHLATLVEERTARWKAETEQHKATATRLADTLELNEKILAASPMGMVAYKASGECIFVNQALASIAGGSREQILEGNFRHLEGWQRSGLLGLAEATLEHNQPRSGEFRDTTRFGKTVWVDAHMTPFVAAGKPHLLAMFYDISQRKRGELLLRTQRDVGVSLSLTSDLPTALNSLVDMVLQLEGVDCGAVYLADPGTGDFRLATYRGKVSQAFLDQARVYPAGSQRARVINQGRPVYDSYDHLATQQDPIRDQEGLRAIALLPLCHEGRAIGSLNLASHQHNQVPAQTRVVLEAMAAQAAGAIARIRAGNALRESQQRLRAIITSVPITLFAVDQDGVITFEEGQALRDLGASPGEHVGQPMARAFGHFPAVLEHLRRALAGEQFSGVVQLGPLVFDCWYCPIRDRDGQFKGSMGVAANITERHRLERQILEISDREQARLGQEIHDGLCQQLVSLAFDANSLERRLAGSAHADAATARRIADLLDLAITEARQLSRGLFPIRMEAEGLVPALEELAKSTQERFQTSCRFESAGPAPVLTQVAATHLYRIAKEAVTNAVKHSQAHAISIGLEVRDAQLELRIEDDGSGIQGSAPAKLAGMGLHIMEYRARSLGGTFRLGRGARQGTAVSCRVPLGHLAAVTPSS